MKGGFRLMLPALLSMLVFPACQKQIVYVNNQSTVSAYELTDSGELVPLPGSPFDKGASDYTAGSDIEIDPTASFLFATNNGSQAVSSFAVSGDGALTLIGTAPTDPSPKSLAIHPSGSFLYVGCVNGGVVVFDVHADGTLTRASSYPIWAPESLDVHPGGQWLFVSGYTTGVWVLEIAGDGSLTPTAGSPYSAGGTAHDISEIRVDASRDILFSKNMSGANIGALSIGAGGALSHIPGSPFADYFGSDNLAISADSQVLYTVSPGLLFPSTWGMISARRIAADGSLTALAGSPFAAQDDYTGMMATTADMRYLVATHTLPERISVYEILADGALAPAPLSPYDSDGTLPRAVRIVTVSGSTVF